MNTPLAQKAHSNILQYKEYASADQFQQMEKQISVFDTDLNGCGFDAIQAKLKLEAISNLTARDFKTICHLFKE